MKKIIGLIKKDFLQQKSVLIILLSTMICVSIIVGASFYFSIADYAALEGGDTIENYIGTLSGIIGSLFLFIYIPQNIVFSSVSFDEKSQFDKFIISSGLKRDYIVHERFIMGIIGSTPSFILYAFTFLGLFNSMQSQFTNIAFNIGYFFLAVGITTLVLSLSLFFTSMFGAIKIQAIFSISFVFFSFLLLGTLFISLFLLENGTGIYLNYGLSALFLILTAVFYGLSIASFRNKDF